MTLVPAVSRLLATELAAFFLCLFFIPFTFIGFHFLWLWLSLIFRINFHFQFDHNVGRSCGSFSGCWCSLFHYWTLESWDTLLPTSSNDRTHVINCKVDYATNVRHIIYRQIFTVSIINRELSFSHENYLKIQYENLQTYKT